MKIPKRSLNPESAQPPSRGKNVIPDDASVARRAFCQPTCGMQSGPGAPRERRRIAAAISSCDGGIYGWDARAT
eukprot:656214-Pyramimonas_sp.AAC.1